MGDVVICDISALPSQDVVEIGQVGQQAVIHDDVFVFSSLILRVFWIVFNSICLEVIVQTEGGWAQTKTKSSTSLSVLLSWDDATEQLIYTMLDDSRDETWMTDVKLWF